MNPIEEATETGYSEDQILNFIAQKYPELTQKITKALNLGYKPKNILNFLTPFFASPQTSREQPTSQQSAHALKRREDIEANKRLMKTAANAALTFAGGAAAGRVLQNVPKLAQIGGLVSKRGLPKAPGSQAAQMAPEVAGVSAQELPEAATAASGIKGKRAADLVREMGLEKRIQNLSNNNPPEIVGSAIKSMLTPGQKTWLKSQTDQPIEEIINEYLQEGPGEVQEKLVITPDGAVGSLVEERQGIGRIQLPSGEIRRKKVSELEEEPPELAKQINDVISALPEEEKSRVLAFASYNPGHPFTFEGRQMNIPFMGVQFHNGDFYMYPGVSKEKFDKVVSKATKAKTSGENEWGVWTKGDPSRGAGMYELIKELEHEFGKNFIKFKASEGYDFWKRFRKELKEYFTRRKRNEV